MKRMYDFLFDPVVRTVPMRPAVLGTCGLAATNVIPIIPDQQVSATLRDLLSIVIAVLTIIYMVYAIRSKKAELAKNKS
jgi:hypothetical protein